MNNRKKRIHLSLLISAALSLSVIICSSCSKGGDSKKKVDLALQRVQTLEDDILGFHLGWTIQEIGEFLGPAASIEPFESYMVKDGREMYNVTNLRSFKGEIEKARLSLFESRLMEIILYYKQIDKTKLESLRRELERKYETKATFPDGTREVAYKTYWIKAPGMTITIRLILKRVGSELYVQYLHDVLDAKLKKSLTNTNAEQN